MLLSLTLLLLIAPVAPNPTTKVEVTAPMVEKFAPAQKLIFEKTIAFYKQLNQELEQRRAAGTQATPAQLQDLAKRGKTHDEEVKRLERESGLSAEEWKATARLFEDVRSERMAWRIAGGDEGIAKTEASLTGKTAKMTEAQRAQVMDQMTGGLRRAKTAEKARKTHGSALVDLVIKVGDPLDLQMQEMQKQAVRK